MPAQPPLIHYLANIKRWIWLAYLAGFFVFLGIVALLNGLSPPSTPANELVGWGNAWLFLLPAPIIGYGFYVGARYWRCPKCGQPLPTKSPVPAQCRHCGTALRG